MACKEILPARTTYETERFRRWHPMTNNDAGLAENEMVFERDTARAALDKRFRGLLSANGAALGRLAASYTRSTNDRDDLLQDIALAIWQALPHFREECSERTFVFRIAHNRAITHITRRRPVIAPEEDIEIPDPSPNPEKGFAQGQEDSRLFDAIQRLPLAYKQVITLFLEDMSYSEIAEVLGIGESNVGVRLNRARQMLRQSLEEKK
jgi:RNA polymerase sigma factor (sigma-70 family)